MNTKPVPIVLDTFEKDECVFELTKHGDNSFDVDCWNADGSNHWNRWFNSEDKARHELNRWRP